MDVSRTPVTRWQPLEAAKAQHARLHDELLRSRRTLEELAAARDVAVAEDRALLAKALRDSTPHPGTEKIAELDRRSAAEQRQLEALELAVRESEDEITAVVERHRTRWQAEQQRAESRAREKLEKALGAYADARHALLEELRLAVFLRDFPAAWRGKATGSGWVLGLASPSGEPVAWDAMRAALEADARGERPTSPLTVKALQ